ncbi:hypothetical protein [Modicisalibacter sp. MOD 31.J]|uniref:hypothetical protein n=1 Tax=Modicisalibacter sp. MOD 31.J TaxID=2831897 RepID=UPI001CCAEE57|nr:hypothetical protein [Modicisalibacter sp. MOD 31.J]MBZ9574589.1 hypothetical protein [Modicisalibacter sp. MOD 31.J]
MTHQHIPVRLKFLGTAEAGAIAPEHYAIKTRVDARTDVSDLKAKLTCEEKWPKGLDRGEIQYAIATLIEQEGWQNTAHPFPDIGLSEPSEGYVVRRQPGREGWLLIEVESPQGFCDPVSAWSTEKQAICASWDGIEGIKPAYAYFVIEVPEPEGYTLFMHEGSWCMEETWGAGSYGPYPTEIDARIAAWRHKLSQAEAEPVEEAPETRFAKGDVFRSDSVLFTAGIHVYDTPARTGNPITNGIECHSESKAGAKALRDQVLGALNASGANAAAEEVRYPMQPIGLDPHGRPRFEPNPIVDYLACTVSDLNHLAVWCAENAVDPKYQEQLAQLIGYSVDGYGTLSYVSDESHERAAAQAERLVASREETITDG